MPCASDRSLLIGVGFALLLPCLCGDAGVTCTPSPCLATGKGLLQAKKLGVHKSQLPVMTPFLDEASKGHWKRVVVLDVGANDGNWSKAMSRLCKIRRGAPCEVVMFEPQPRFASKLKALARSSGARYVAAAAWRTNEMLPFYLSPNTEASSVSTWIPTKWGALSKVDVPAVDLAEYMRHTLRLPLSDRETLTLVKIDVESSEYEVIPHLIAHGALCGVRYLHVEWHLDGLPPEKRLAGLTVMVSLEHMLQITCAAHGRTAPVLVVREQSIKKRGLYAPGVGDLGIGLSRLSTLAGVVGQ